MRVALILALPLLAMTGIASAQEHAGHHMAAPPPADAPVVTAAETPAPIAAKDHAADPYYDPAAMAKARDGLRYESGGMPNSMLLVDRLEWRPGRGADGYAWEAEGWIGGDIDRFAYKTKGEGSFGGSAEKAEVQALWSHALDPWFNLQVGVRQDFRPDPRRTYATVGIEGIAPYWFKLEGQLFLSSKGEASARIEANYDQRITQRLIAQPAVELNLAAQDVQEIGMGAGLNSVELGLRVRYEIVREFAPYVGVHWEKKLGQAADYARDEGESSDSLRFVTGIRFWF